MLYSAVYVELNPCRLLPSEPEATRASSTRCPCFTKPFKMNTYTSLSKQATLTVFRMNTYRKPGGGWLWLTYFHSYDRLRYLFGAEEGVAQKEEHREDPDERADFAILAGAYFNEGEGEHTQAETRSDAERERGGDQRQESGKRF